MNGAPVPAPVPVATGSLWLKSIVAPSPGATSFLCLKGLYPTEATKPTAQGSGSRQVICFYKNSQNRRAVRRMGESWGGHLTERPCAAGLGACLQVSGYCKDWSSHPLVDTWGWGEAELGSESPIKQAPGQCGPGPQTTQEKEGKRQGGRETMLEAGRARDDAGARTR